MATDNKKGYAMSISKMDTHVIHNAVQKIMGADGFDLTACSLDMKIGAEKIVSNLLQAERREMARRIRKVIRFTHDTKNGMVLSPKGAWVFLEDVLKALYWRGKI